MPDNLGPSWPGWVTESTIGKGGFGQVYRITRNEFGIEEEAALKIITIPHDDSQVEEMRSEGFDDASITQEFYGQVGTIVKEYKLMLGLRNCPNIVHCDDFRVVPHENGMGWDVNIKMELLTPILKAPESLKNERQVLKLARDLCHALDVCQQQNILHRDIKPQNIFLAPDGNFKLGDFGIARTAERTTNATKGIGTYNYMAPEVLRGEPYGASADIYSLGLVLYWLLNERRQPFLPLPPDTYTTSDAEQARRRRFSGEKLPAPKHGSEALKKIVLKACEYNPKRRYQTAGEMLEALNAIGAAGSDPEKTEPIRRKKQTAQPEPATDADVTQIQRVRQPKKKPAEKKPEQKKKPVKWIVLAVLAVLIAGAAIVMLSRQGSGESAETSLQTDAIPVETQAAEPLPAEALANQDDAWRKNVLRYDHPGRNLDIDCDGVIMSVIFLDSTANAPADAVDLSQAQDGSVLSWLEETRDYQYVQYADKYGIKNNRPCYLQYVAADGGINASKACKSLFLNMGFVCDILFNDAFHTEGATDMSSMFYGCDNLRRLDLSGFDTSSVTDMGHMFYNCARLVSLDLSSFDTASVNNMYGMFHTCTDLRILDVSSFDTSNVYTMQEMFSYCTSIDKVNLSSFDTSNVNTMYRMFFDCDSLTSIDLSSFDTSSVTNMSGMFGLCENLQTANLGSFNTALVTDMSEMFIRCDNLKDYSFLDSFNFSRVQEREQFMNEDVTVDGNHWDTLFTLGPGTQSILRAASFSGNDPLKRSDESFFTLGIKRGKIISVSFLDSLKEAPADAKDLSQDKDGSVLGWTVPYEESDMYVRVLIAGNGKIDARNCEGLFSGCINLEEISFSKGFDTSKATSMAYMFSECMSLRYLDLSALETASVTSMERMFHYCSRLTELDVTSLDTSSVTNMEGMFSNVYAVEHLDMGGFDTSNVTNMRAMFSTTISGDMTRIRLVELNMVGWDTSRVTDMSSMFNGCHRLYPPDLSTFDFSSVTKYDHFMMDGKTTMDGTPWKKLFNSAPKWQDNVLRYDADNKDNLVIPNSGDVLRMIFLDTRKNAPSDAIDVSQAQNRSVLTWVDKGSRTQYVAAEGGINAGNACQGLFSGWSSLEEIQFNGSFHTEEATNMSNMFQDCANLSTLDLRGFDTASVTKMQNMFGNCKKLKSLNVGTFDTAKVTTMCGMFANCEVLNQLELDHFDTSSVTDMSYMFGMCVNLSDLRLANFNTSSVRNMTGMFMDCRSLTDLDLSGFDFSSVTKYGYFMPQGMKVNGKPWGDLFR